MTLIHRLRRPRPGMTILEVMVAVSLLSLMGMLVYGSLTITIKSQKRAVVLQERYHAARVFLQKIKRDLSMSFVSLHQAEDQRTQTGFIGESDQVIFNTSSYEPRRRDAHESDQVEVEYRLDRDEDGNPAILRRLKHYIDDRFGKGGEEEVVIQGVKDFELSYYDRDKEDWRDDWEVTIEDAREKRELLKVIQMEREQVEDLRNDEKSGVAGVAAAEMADKLIDKVENEAMDQLFLPYRVRIRLVIQDDQDREYAMETQTQIHVTEPLWY